MRAHTRRPGRPRALRALARGLEPGAVRGEIPEVEVTGLTADSRQVAPGDLFVALEGGRADGHRYVAEAARRGARAAVVRRAAEGAGVPLLRVADTRRALARLASAWHGDPAAELTLVGVTGTLGKTSTVQFLEAMLAADGRLPGSVGSLGIRAGRETVEETGFTAPEPVRLYEGLGELRDRGCAEVLMEATTHGLSQGRLEGIRFDLGIFTGLVPLEHMDYHGTFRHYVESKRRFFRHLRREAPLVYQADDRALRAVVEAEGVWGIACGTGEEAEVRLRVEGHSPSGTAIRLEAPGGVPLRAGGRSAPLELAVRLPVLGRSVAVNALLASAAALSLGAAPGAVREALGSLTAAPRRTHLLQTEPVLILDDYGGHPEIISAAFDVVGALRWRRLHVVCGYRGMRGEEVNRRAAEALGIWLRRYGAASVCLTEARERADDRCGARPEEMQAFQEALRRADVPFRAERRADRALEAVLPRVEPGDLLLVLGSRDLDGVAQMAGQRLQRPPAAR